MDRLFSLAESFDRTVTDAFRMPDTCPREAEIGAWFIRPSHHLIESGIIGGLALIAFIVYTRRFRAELRSLGLAESKLARPVAAAHVPLWVRALDVTFAILLVISALTVVWHKYHGAKMAYLLQPCHLLHALLLFILSLPRGSARGAVLLGIYLHELSGPFLGTAAVDLSCYTQRFEALNWGVQHGLLLLVPLHLLYSRRFGSRVHGGASLFGLSFAAMVLLHYGLLVPVSILTGTNLNYVLCAPHGQDLMRRFARWYRLPTLVVCGVLAMVLRYGVIAGFLKLITDDKVHLKEVKSLAKVAAVEPDELASELTSTTKKQSSSQGKEGLRQRG